MDKCLSVPAQSVAAPKATRAPQLAKLAGLLVLVGGSAVAHAQKVTWVASTEAEKWKVTENVRSAKVAGPATPLQIFADQPLQAIEGFGGCFNEAGNGANSYMYWNMVLDETGRSTWGWVQNALITVNKATGQVRYNPEFYLMKHLSHYVRPGAKRLATSEGNHLTFRNADGSTVLLLVNTAGAAQTFTITLGARQTTVTVQAKSFNTLRWPG